ncbi:MAG: hypothetical protein AAGB26_17850 [Planctomycetota bacterium]
MQPHRRICLALILLAITLPVWAEEAGKKADEKPTIYGVWYLQSAMDEMVPAGTMKIDFTKEGVVRAYQDDEEDDTNPFKIDQDKSEIVLYESDGEEVEVTLSFAIKDGVLTLTGEEEFDGEKFAFSMELTRNPEGTEKHQQAREAQGDDDNPLSRARSTARAMQSSTQMRGIHQGAVTASTIQKGAYPPSIGAMLVEDYFTPEYVLSPWSEVEIAEDFDDWPKQKKIDWANTNTSYVYLLAGKKEQLNPEIIALFEIPSSADQEKVRVAFEDNSVQAMSFEDADKLIKKQTNVSLKEWMTTTSPGTGEYLPPEDEE